MAVLQEFKCPCCDGAIEFDTSSQKMKCPYCDTEFEVEALKTYGDELQTQQEENILQVAQGTVLCVLRYKPFNDSPYYLTKGYTI